MTDLKLLLTAFTCLAAVTGCTVQPPQAYYNRGDPENLIDVSSEVVNLGISTPGAVAEMTDMISQDPPSRAILSCAEGEAMCSQARRSLDQHGVPTQLQAGPAGVTLVYERVTARDCESRFIDNSINPYHLHHPSFGCSITGNMVQMVSDKRQFVSPGLLDFSDGVKAVQVYERHASPKTQDQINRSEGAIQTIIK